MRRWGTESLNNLLEATQLITGTQLFFRACDLSCSTELCHQSSVPNSITLVCWHICHLFLIYFFTLFYFCSITVVCIFSPSLHHTPAEPTSLLHLHPPPWFCPCVLCSSSCKPLSPLSPPHSPLAIVTLSLISMSLFIFYLLFSFVDYVPVKGEIIWYLSFTTWLI